MLVQTLRRIGLLVMTILLMAVQPSYSKVLDSSVTYNALLGNQVAEEGLVRLTLPEALIEQVLKETLVATEENPEQYIKEITKFKLDPANNLILLEGVALIPQSVVLDMNEIAGGEAFVAEHNFQLIAELPSAQKLGVSKYFILKIVKLEVDGMDYTSMVNRLSQFLKTMLSNTSFMDWVLADDSIEDEEVEEGESLSVMINRLFESKQIMFRNNSIYAKLDFSKIEALAAYSSLTNFRLWNVKPVILKGTDITALQVEAGLGVPGETWFNAIAARGEGEAQSLEEARARYYEELGNVDALVSELTSFAKATKTQMNIPEWKASEQTQFDQMISYVESRVRSGLSFDNPLFKADPQWGYSDTKEDTKAYILSSLAEIKRKVLTRVTIANGGVEGKAFPMLTQTLSQRSLSQGLRFARDFQFENEQLFPEIEVVLAPQLPGVIVRGLMNMDMNVFMEMGLEGEGIDWGSKPWRLAEDVWGSAIPFEVGLRIHTFDEGRVGLDVTNFALFSGSERTVLSKSSGHGHLMMTWTKMALVEALTTLAMDDPAEALETSEEVEEEDHVFKKTIQKINEQVNEYAKTAVVINKLDIDSLMTVAEIDITKNPFNTAGEEAVATKVRYLFEDVVEYDEEQELVIFRLDPKLVSETILESKNSLQLWNFQTLYDSTLNQSFIELSVGDGTRSQGFLDYLINRPQQADSETFVGIDESRDSTPSDLVTSMQLDTFENFINRIFSEASAVQAKEVNVAIKKEIEQSHYLMRDLNIEAGDHGDLKVNLAIEMIEKKKRNVIARFFGDDYKTTRKTALVSTSLILKTKKLSDYKENLKLAANEVTFGDEVLVIDLESAGLKLTGETSTLENIVSFIASDINFKKSTVAKLAKLAVMKFLEGYLHSTDPKENGNISVAGVHLNRYAKFLPHKEELLIQLNPHLMGVAFDLRLIDQQDFNGQPIGLEVSKEDDRIAFHFSTSGNMAAVDKGELLDIMRDSKKLFNEINKTDTNLDASEVIAIYDQALHNSDITKLSLFHRLTRVIKNYEGVLNIVEPDTSVIDTLNASLNSEFGLTSGEFNSRQLSGSGVELMYFMSSAYYLQSSLKALITKIEDQNIDVAYFDFMKFKIEEIQDRFLDPIMKSYRQNFMANNAKIVAKGPTDWNYTYYPDALYCQAIYKFFNNLEESKGGQ